MIHHPDPGEWVVVAHDDNAHPRDWCIARVCWADGGDVVIETADLARGRELVCASDLRASSLRREDMEAYRRMCVDLVAVAERQRDEARVALQAGIEAAHRAVSRALTEVNSVPARRRRMHDLAEAARAPSEFDARPVLRPVQPVPGAEPFASGPVARLAPEPAGGDAA